MKYLSLTAKTSSFDAVRLTHVQLSQKSHKNPVFCDFWKNLQAKNNIYNMILI